MHWNKRLLAGFLAMTLLLTACGPASTGSGNSTESRSQEASQEEGHVHAHKHAHDQDQSKELSLEELKKTPALGQATEIDGVDGQKYYKNTVTFYDVFDTVVQITMFVKDEADFQSLVEAGHAEFLRLHKLYDNYHAYAGVTNLYTLNEKAGKGPVPVDPDLFNLLRFCLENYEKTLGKVNIAMGNTLELWQQAREKALLHADEQGGVKPEDIQGKTPDADALEASRSHAKIGDLVLDPAASTVFFKDPDLKLDAGAVAKGYATELVAKKLQAEGLAHGIISAGGNVRLIGQPVDGRDQWKIGLTHPRAREDSMIAALSLEGDQSVVTSGDYQRFFYVGDQRYHHIIDPLTLFPGGQFLSVSVVTADSGLADLLSTAFFLSNLEEAEEILENFSDLSIDLLWVDPKLEITTTDGLVHRVEKME